MSQKATLDKFARQARDYADCLADVHSPIWFYHYEKKFAELIIAECAGAIIDAECNDTDYRPIRDTLKRHFEIDE